MYILRSPPDLHQTDTISTYLTGVWRSVLVQMSYGSQLSSYLLMYCQIDTISTSSVCHSNWTIYFLFSTPLLQRIERKSFIQSYNKSCDIKCHYKESLSMSLSTLNFLSYFFQDNYSLIWLINPWKLTLVFKTLISNHSVAQLLTCH